MTQLAFGRLYEAVEDSGRLEAAYNGLLNDLFGNPFWEAGPTNLRRVLWSQGWQARAEDNEAFGSPGLYLWGIEKRPLYLGITRGSFNRRFSRYIWSDRSQCKLAQKFRPDLVEKGIEGFPVEIRGWYARNYRGSKIRLLGAVRFAKEGIDQIWFTLFPHAKTNLDEIRELERALIPVADRWNQRHGFKRLLNVEGQKTTP